MNLLHKVDAMFGLGVSVVIGLTGQIRKALLARGKKITLKIS